MSKHLDIPDSSSTDPASPIRELGYATRSDGPLRQVECHHFPSPLVDYALAFTHMDTIQKKKILYFTNRRPSSTSLHGTVAGRLAGSLGDGIVWASDTVILR